VKDLNGKFPAGMNTIDVLPLFVVTRCLKSGRHTSKAFIWSWYVSDGVAVRPCVSQLLCLMYFGIKRVHASFNLIGG
jgi:hypothetical protein